SSAATTCAGNPPSTSTGSSWVRSWSPSRSCSRCVPSSRRGPGRPEAARARRVAHTAPAMAAVYRTFMEDSSRWDRFTFRSGDIVITTPRKSGTTWTQTLCALLIFDGATFPAPLSRLSPWLDQRVSPIDDILATYEEQQHRRVIKTHTPLDGVP